MMELKIVKTTKNNEKVLYKDYLIACKDPKFKALVNNLNLGEKQACKWTSSLEQSTEELSHCEKCSSLLECTNKLSGYAFTPRVSNEKLIFSYVICPFKKRQEAKQNSKEQEEWTLKSIDLSDSKRTKTIKWIVDFARNYEKGKPLKSLYLSGNFGSGKTFLITALFNELKKKRIDSHIVYYPDLIRKMKTDFDTQADIMDYLTSVPLLLLDDIGAEKVSEWSRDEILGTILQSRMNANLPTFFTSNLDLKELESHLSINGQSEDKIKAKRIIERISFMCDYQTLISENRRK